MKLQKVCFYSICNIWVVGLTEYQQMELSSGEQRTRTPHQPPFECPGSFPCSIKRQTLAFQHGFSPDRSIQESTVVRRSPLKIMGSMLLACATIAKGLIFQPARFMAFSINSHVNGENQLWYFEARATNFFLRPDDFFLFSWNFFFRACAGRESSAMDDRIFPFDVSDSFAVIIYNHVNQKLSYKWLLTYSFLCSPRTSLAHLDLFFLFTLSTLLLAEASPFPFILFL